MALKPLVTIENFNKGIVTDPTLTETAGGEMFVGLDIHREESTLQVSQKLTAEAGTFTDLIKWIVRDENDLNFKYWALGDTGNLYKVTDIGGTWVLNGNVGGHGNGLAVYNGSKWYCTDTQLIGSSTHTIDTATYHPLAIYLGCLYGGADRYIFKLESDGTFTKHDLTLPEGFKVKSLDVYGDLLMIGIWMGDSITDKAESYLFSWDGTSDFPNQAFPMLQENGMNAMISWENILLVFAGIQGNVYAFNNAYLDKAKTIPKVAPTAGDYVFVNPGAVAQYGGNVLVGVSVGSGSALGGVYTLGRKTEDLPFALTLSNPISTGFTDVEIGAILSGGSNKFLVSWKRGATYGLDALDNSAKYSSGYFETQKYEVMEGNKPRLVKGIAITAEPLPANTSVVIQEDIDGSGTYADWGTITSANQHEMLSLLARAKIFQAKITLNASANNSPKIKVIQLF